MPINQITGDLQNISLVPKIKHQYQGCEETATYPTGDCRKCKNKKAAEYQQTAKGQIIKEHSIAKTRFARRAKKLKDVMLELESDMDIIGMPDNLKRDLKDMKATIQTFCDLNMRSFRPSYESIS